jgi:hypothetical protein
MTSAPVNNNSFVIDSDRFHNAAAAVRRRPRQRCGHGQPGAADRARKVPGGWTVERVFGMFLGLARVENRPKAIQTTGPRPTE